MAHMLVVKVMQLCGYVIEVVLDREMTGRQPMQFGVREIPQEGFPASGREKHVVLAPKRLESLVDGP